MYTHKIEQAIKAAALLHGDQLRKGSVPLPYVTHLVAVMMILRDYTNEEDILVAALLHDTLEDTDYTEKELEEDFGKKVMKLVKTVSEPERNGEHKLNWLQSRKQYATQLKNGPVEAVMIAAADKIHNFRSVIDEYYEDHDRFLVDFGPRTEDRIDAYQTISNAINNRLKDGIVHEFNHTFAEYKKFIFNVQATQDKI